MNGRITYPRRLDELAHRHDRDVARAPHLDPVDDEHEELRHKRAHARRANLREFADGAEHGGFFANADDVLRPRGSHRRARARSHARGDGGGVRRRARRHGVGGGRARLTVDGGGERALRRLARRPRHAADVSFAAETTPHGGALGVANRRAIDTPSLGRHGSASASAAPAASPWMIALDVLGFSEFSGERLEHGRDVREHQSRARAHERGEEPRRFLSDVRLRGVFEFGDELEEVSSQSRERVRRVPRRQSSDESNGDESHVRRFVVQRDEERAKRPA